jgi:hypothetical protein
LGCITLNETDYLTVTRIALSIWIKRFDPPPTFDTVKRWAAAGTIRLWQGRRRGRIYVEEIDAVPYVSAEDLADMFRRAG